MAIVKSTFLINLIYFILIFLFRQAHASLPFADEGADLEAHNQTARTIKPSDLTHFSRDFIPNRFRIADGLGYSGSQQYTPEGLCELITTKIPCRNKGSIVFVDLREEPHLMLYSHATSSIQSAKARAYNGLSAKTIQENESAFAQSYPIYQTEEACVKELGAHYYRIPVTDATRPEDSDVESFITLLRGMQGKNCWLHFHCLAGLGRTTTFMAMYEMVKTAHLGETSLNDIIEHQHQIGGANLAFMWYSNSHVQWLTFLQNFYEYSKYGFHQGVSWSQWVEQCHLEPFQEHPTRVSTCSLSYFCAYAKSVVMMNAMRFTQIRRQLFG